MSDADPGQPAGEPAPALPRRDEPPPFTPPAPPPPGPDDSTQVIGAAAGTGGPAGHRPSRQPAGRPAGPTSGFGRDPGRLPGAKGVHSLAGQAEHLLERPGSSAAWAILLAIAIYWLSSAVGGLAHGSTFRDTVTQAAAYSGPNGRQRLDAFLAVGSYVMAFALVLALGLALLVPTKKERETATDRRAGAPNGSGQATEPAGVGTGPFRTGERASQRLLLVLTLAGVVVALAAVIMFISDLSHVGVEPDLSVQGAIEDLAAIPVALVVALWAGSRVTAGVSAGDRHLPGSGPDRAGPRQSPPAKEPDSPPTP